MEQNKPAEKTNKAAIIIIVLIIITVVGYALWQQSGKQKDNNKNAVSLEGQLDLTQDNLISTWIKHEGELRHEIGFELSDNLIYCCFNGDKVSPEFVSVDGSYAINGNVISVKYTIDSVDYSEQYYAAVSKEKLILSPIEGSSGTLKGTYDNIYSLSQDSESASDTSASDTKDTEESSFIEPVTEPQETTTPETQAPPEITAPPETQAPPETTAAPEPPAFDTDLLLGLWMTDGNSFYYNDVVFSNYDEIPTLLLNFESNNTGVYCYYEYGCAEPNVEKNFTYYVTGDLLHLVSDKRETVYRIEFNNGTNSIMTITYVSGARLNTWQKVTFLFMS